jgi:hypothetical protein
MIDRERRYFRRERQLTYTERGRTRRVVPDAGYLISVETEHGRRLLPQMFLELENGTHSLAAVREKLRRWQRWAELGANEDLSRLYQPHGELQKSSFRLLLVAHDKHGLVSDRRRLLDLLTVAAELPRNFRSSIWLTSAETLRNHARSALPLDAAVWVRAKDLSSGWAGSLKTEPVTKAVRRRLSAQLACLPRHRLLPEPEQGAGNVD